jgi:hypothetical protein
MAIERHSVARPVARARPGRLLGGGTVGNERLTAAAGALLIVLLAVIGVTIVQLGPLLSVHSLSADYGSPASRGGPVGLRADVSGRYGRTLSLASALTIGLVLATLVIPQFGPWLSAR